MKEHSKIGDAFGLTLWDFYEKGSSFEIVGRDDGLIAANTAGRYWHHFRT